MKTEEYGVKRIVNFDSLDAEELRSVIQRIVEHLGLEVWQDETRDYTNFTVATAQQTPGERGQMNLAKPPKEHTEIPKYRDHTNQTINLDKVLSFKKSRESYYPDNEGIPIIRFWFGGDSYTDWYFDRGEEAKRDKTYDSIAERATVKEE